MIHRLGIPLSRSYLMARYIIEERENPMIFINTEKGPENQKNALKRLRELVDFIPNKKEKVCESVDY
jgi:hypothetical protein